MATNGKKIQDIILQKLDRIETAINEVRTKDIPNMKIDIAVVKTESKSSARVVAGIGGAIAIAVSTAVAFFK